MDGMNSNECFAKHRSRTTYIPSVEELLSTPYQQGQPLYPLEEIIRERKLIPSVLIVPMGTTPMIATQLYTLLRSRERRDIRKVILLYPEVSGMVYESVQTTKKAFKHEKVLCEDYFVPKLEDITTEEDCRRYQAKLENIIQREQETFLLDQPGGFIDLALSGVAKGWLHSHFLPHKGHNFMQSIIRLLPVRSSIGK